MRLDVIRAVEACYAGAPDDTGWLREIIDALAPLDLGGGLLAQVFRMDLDGRRSVEATAAQRSPCPGVLDRVETSFASLGCPRELWAATEPVAFALRRAKRVGPRAHAEIARLFASEGIDDALGIFAAEPDGRIAFVAAPIRGRRRPGPQTLHRLKLLSAHLGASLRLRRAVGDTGPEAVLEPDGRIVDAAAGTHAAARRSLSDAVRLLERARGPMRRSDPDAALQIWRGLVDGTWSLVDRCDRDGRRYVLARRNPPAVRDPKALTGRERAVVAFAALGHQNKFIAYALGLLPSAVAANLASARRKLGLASRAELVREFASLVRAGEVREPQPPGA